MNQHYETPYSEDNIRKHMTLDATRFVDDKKRFLWACDIVYNEAMMLRAYIRHHAGSSSPVFIMRKHTLCVRVLVALELLESTLKLCDADVSSDIRVFAEHLAQLHRILRKSENYEIWVNVVDVLPFALAALFKLTSSGGPWPKYALDTEQCTIAAELNLEVNQAFDGMDIDPLEVTKWVTHFLGSRKADILAL